MDGLISFPISDSLVDIRVGDCLEVLPTLAEKSVHCCVCSPPYYQLRDYNVEGQIGLEATPEKYVDKLVTVFHEIWRVLRDDGTVWLNLGDSYANWVGPSRTKGHFGSHDTCVGTKVPRGLKEKDLIGIPWRVALALQADGWWLRSDIIWHKPNPMPESVTDRPTSAHEHIFLLTKNQRYFFDADAVREPPKWAMPIGTKRNASRQRNVGGRTDGFTRISQGGGVGCPEGGRNLRNVWTIVNKPFKGGHFAAYPPDLIMPCIKAGSSEKGVCPHCGAPWIRQSKRETMTIGWLPSCRCPTHEPVPATILDPFGGAGTTGLVAQQLGRRSILIELNPAYAELARERVRVI